MNYTRGDIIYKILKPPVTLFLKLRYNMQVETNAIKNVREPYLLLGHHVHDLDPIFSNTCANRLIRYIAGDANQDSGLKRFLLGILESIPFTKNRSDAKSIRELVRHVKQGHPVGLYPEGGRNWDGVTDHIVPATAKLVKFLNIPVYFTFYKGGYLTRPRWASHSRRGTLVVDTRLLLDRQDIARMSADEIHALLVEKLAYNEYDWQQQNQIPFRGRNLAEHIERLLYICPCCQAVNSLASRGDSFHCTACGRVYTLDCYGTIHGCPEFSDPAAWNKWQRTQLPRIIGEGISFINSGLLVEKISLDNGRQRHRVDLTVASGRLDFAPPLDETLDISQLTSASITFADVVEFYVGKTKYRLTFNPQQHMSVKLFYDLLMAQKGVH